MKILITGSSGFLGKHFIEYFSKLNFSILAMYNKNKPNDIRKKNVRFIRKDIKNFKNIHEIKKFRPEILIHLAWKDIPNFSFNKSKENLVDSINFINEITKINSCKKIIVTGSSFEKNIDKKNIYFVWAKNTLRDWLSNECKNKNIDLGWFRVFYVFGPGQRKKSLIPEVIKSLKNKKKPKIKNLYASNDFIYIKDVIKMIALSINKKNAGKTFDIGSGKLTPIWKICNSVEKNLTGTNIYFKKIQKKHIKKHIIKNNTASIKKYMNKFGKIKFTNMNVALKETIMEY